MLGGGRDSRPARARSLWHPDRTGPGQPFGADRRRQVLRPGAPAPLAEGGALSRVRQRQRGPGRARRDPAAAAALSVQGSRRGCAGRFDDLTGTVLAGHHQPLRVWVLCLIFHGPVLHGPDFLGLNLSNRQIAQDQIAQELGLDGSDVQAMTEQLRRGLVAKAPPVRLEGEVEIDEVYVVAGHKGQPAAVAKRGARDGAAGWRARRAAARWRRTSRPSSARSSAAGRSSCACWPMCGRRPSGRSSRPPSPRAPASTPASTPATPARRPGATGT